MTQAFNLAQVILDTAQRYPERAAFRAPGGTIGYERFAQTVLGYAARMRELGIDRNARVSIAVLNPVLQIWTALACALLGCGWVHGNKSVAGNDSLGVTHVVRSGNEAGLESDLCIDKSWLPQREMDVKTFEGFASPDSIWVIAQSSGTTGNTKFMAISAAAQSRRLANNPFDYLGDAPPVACSLMHPLSVYGMEYVLKPLMMGGTVVVSDNIRFMAAAGVTTVIGAPSQYLPLCEQPPHAKIPCAVIGGAHCSEELFDRLLERFELIQHQFGCSEMGRISFNRFGAGAANRGSVGKPIPSAQIQIVDSGDRPVPAGNGGVLRVRSDAPISGYIGGEPSGAFRSGWFYSGDTGFLSEDGALTVTGRVNDVVNFGGTKLDANALDDAIAATEGVKEGVCFAQAGFSPMDEMAVLIVPSGGNDAKLVARRVHANLAAKFGLAARRIYVAAALPRNDNGKIARRMLSQFVADRVPFEIAEKATNAER
ncbi:MAG TPA: class I adenylate-forming enzyme family protein [Rhizomicrobium sp.]|nr:class I adenylate-forming enzyme family protein [Rhizomicrobium sp.]